MDNFRFHAYTKMLFGKGQIKNLKQEVSEFGLNVLLAYGGGSIKKNGIYNQVMKQLEGCNIWEISGIEPNPRIESVRNGAQVCKDEKIDVVLAVGGGSTIDCSKMIAAGACYDGDPWDLVIEPSKIKKALPVVSVLTLAATGSEMNGNAVISDITSNKKIGTFSWEIIPRVSICDPEYLFSLPAYQTAAGTADIMSHVIEDYFKKEENADIQDSFAEGILRTCIRNCPIALKDPANYDARANLMWASSMGLNGLCGSGKAGGWSCHPMEHQLSAFYDITHGAGLAILTPRWMRHILSENTAEKFADYAVRVWGIPEETDRFSLAEKGIDATEKFFKDCGIPMTFEEVGINDRSNYEAMASEAAKSTASAYVPLSKEDIIKIFEACEK